MKKYKNILICISFFIIGLLYIPDSIIAFKNGEIFVGIKYLVISNVFNFIGILYILQPKQNSKK